MTLWHSSLWQPRGTDKLLLVCPLLVLHFHLATSFEASPSVNCAFVSHVTRLGAVEEPQVKWRPDYLPVRWSYVPQLYLSQFQGVPFPLHNRLLLQSPDLMILLPNNMRMILGFSDVSLLTSFSQVFIQVIGTLLHTKSSSLMLKSWLCCRTWASVLGYSN